jgi:DNA polymerase elongation subunit (family B)
MADTQDRNYVAAWYDWATDKVVVLERDQQGTLFKKRYNAPYYFYVPDEEGEHVSIFGDKLLRAEFSSRDEYEAAKRHFPVRFESDFRPLQRVLMDYYYDRPAPPVFFAFVDIEVDYSKKIGFAGPTNPYAVINAVTIYQSWTQKYLTYVIPPKVDGVLWTDIPGNTVERLYDEINSLISQDKLRAGIIPEIVICKDELELLTLMLDAIQEADIISGWNSEFFDIPYICERLKLAGGESLLARLEHVGLKPPKKEMVNRYGTEEPVYKFYGRSHLDYMRLFEKFTFEGRTSYALGNILQEEVGIGKLQYDGSLEQLYHNDFPTFTAYNFRDVDGLVQLDAKFKFIALANQMAHESTVLFDAVLGTVSYVETAITNHAHYKMNRIVHDKNISEHDKVEGAVVLTPKIGLHGWLGSVDINSLYPNTIRSLNISPEKIVGQFTSNEDAWKRIRSKDEEASLCCIFEDGSQEMASAAEWKQLLIENNWAISAYGTVFDQGNGRGVVADILGFWYAERKRLQAEKKKYGKLAKELPPGPEKEEAKRQEEHYDLLQLTKKISMNSLYGALLNVAFRFGDERMGASVTASGRQITTHMIETIGYLLTGQWNPLVKTTSVDKNGKLVHEYSTESEAIIYGDTDSCYYLCMGATTMAEAIEIADAAAEGVNDTFPSFMREVFNCQEEFNTLIKAGREIVGIRGLFQAKKKYMIKVVDLEGAAVDKMKSMGSEIKKSDTPKVIQKFLKTTVDMILDGRDYDSIATYVNQQRKHVLKNLSIFNLGVAKQVNNLDKFTAEYNNPGSMRSDSGGKLTIPGHARAACNYNLLLDAFDKGTKPIKSGDKVLVFYLKKNDYDFESIAFPAEMSDFPAWFTQNFSVDITKTENRMFDSKLAGIFSALGKDVPTPRSVLINSILEF